MQLDSQAGILSGRIDPVSLPAITPVLALLAGERSVAGEALSSMKPTGTLQQLAFDAGSRMVNGNYPGTCRHWAGSAGRWFPACEMSTALLRWMHKAGGWMYSWAPNRFRLALLSGGYSIDQPEWPTAVAADG